MKKLIKAVVLTPLWPAIWFQVGFSLRGQCTDWCCKEDTACGTCCRRAKALVRWYQK